MGKIFLIFFVCLLLISFISSYYCIYPDDNQDMKEFKQWLNILSVEEDLKQGVTQQAILIKIKLFNPCGN